jgi:V/A-type H+/Na+-transporting ATPase subunit I
MIVALKRLTLLCLTSEREAAVETIRELGVVHVVPSKAPAGEDLEALRSELARSGAALSSLDRAARETRSATTGSAVDLAPQDIVERALELEGSRKQLDERAETLTGELSQYAAFGDFDPARIEELRHRGVHVRLGRATTKARLAAPEGFVLRLLGRDAEGLAFCVVAAHAFDLEELDLGAPVSLVPPPVRPPGETRRLVAEIAERRGEIASELAALAAGRAAVATREQHLGDQVRFETVRAGMGEAATVVYLQGYVPVEAVDALREAARREGWAVVLDEPSEDEAVPTLLHYRRWVRPIRAMVDFLRIYPGYREDDIGWAFLIFFTLFVGMLVGDSIYGSLLVVVAVVLRIKSRRVPGDAADLLLVVGVAAMVWGMLTGSYLGTKHLPEPLQGLQVAWLTDRKNVMELCFLIGAVHLTIAHVWNMAEVQPRTKIVAQVGWIGVLWGMFLLARTMVLGYALPGFVVPLLLGSIVAVVLFMATPREFKEAWINHAILPLTIIGSFVDVLSYVRLFAVGYASVAVIAAFNDMAASLGWGNPVTVVAAVVLLLLAHTLNLILCALAVLVHAVRLNTLEFSTHKGLGWQGFRYEAFGGSST